MQAGLRAATQGLLGWHRAWLPIQTRHLRLRTVSNATATLTASPRPSPIALETHRPAGTVVSPTKHPTAVRRPRP
jgi:hypothetical protein